MVRLILRTILAVAVLSIGIVSAWALLPIHQMLPLAQPRIPATTPVATDENQTLGYFDYSDPDHGMSARVYLPEALGKWAIENPWRGANDSILVKPDLFVKSNFQSVADPKFYGLIRVVYDMKEFDCGNVFSKLTKALGFKLERFNVSDIKADKPSKLYVFEYLSNDKSLVADSKLLCYGQRAVELFVVSPNEAKYTQTITDILANSEINITGQ